MEFEYIEHRKGLPYKLFLVSIGHRSHHFHSDMEIIYVQRGKIEVQVQHKTHTLEEGDLFLLHPYEIHSINDVSLGEVNTLLIIQITAQRLPMHKSLFSSVEFHTPILKDAHNRLKQLMFKMYLESFNAGCQSDFLLNGYLLEFIGILLKYEPHLQRDVSSTVASEDFERIQYVIDYVEANFTTKIRLEDLANALHLNKYYLSHLITERLGINLQSYINNVRFTHALRLLLNTNLSILEVAIQSGFSDVKYFNAMVKSHYGMTAAKLRKRSEPIIFSIPNAPVGSIHLPINQERVMTDMKYWLNNRNIVI